MKRGLYLWILSLVALAIFLWPFWTLGFSFDQGLIQILVIPAIVLCAGAALLLLDGELIGPKQVACWVCSLPLELRFELLPVAPADSSWYLPS